MLQRVLAVSMPWRDDAAVKDYLLWPERRSGMLQQQAGSSAVIQGMQGCSFVGDKLFICLHYHLEAGGALRPVQCATGSRSTGHDGCACTPTA